MSQIKFKKKQSANQITIDVALPPRRYINEPVIEFSNSEMIEYLQNEGIVVEDYELSDQTHAFLTSYSNKVNPPALEGSWTYTKKQQKSFSKSRKKMNKNTEESFNLVKDLDESTGD